MFKAYNRTLFLTIYSGFDKSLAPALHSNIEFIIAVFFFKYIYIFREYNFLAARSSYLLRHLASQKSLNCPLFPIGARKPDPSEQKSPYIYITYILPYIT